MSSVDDRIVNMQFNNKQFVEGAAESQRSLEGLDRTIANTGKSGGLETMGTAVDGIRTKFSAMEIAGAAALATIVSKATSAGLGLIKSLTLDPITQGFSEYTTNLNSIQTVMANTGESVNVVNGYMQKLNQYSDQTIYNFSEMARNIGTFTAAGVDLETATSAIQGIANLAALSGSNSQQASTAMYQLSQAIAAGRVGLMDWNSVVNAGMGGKVFQTALAQNAIGMGEITAGAVNFGSELDKLTVNGESFRTSISAAAGGASWLSSDVLVKTLSLLDGRLSVAAYKAKGLKTALAEDRVETQKNKLVAEGYAPAIVKSMTEVANRAYESATVVKTLPQLVQVVEESIGSIWSNTFMTIIGNFNQSKALWSSVSEEITGTHGFLTKMGNSWAHLLRGWVNQGGRNQVIKGFGNIFSSLGQIMKAFRRAWSDIFPPATKDTLIAMSKGFLEFTKHLELSGGTVRKLKNIFSGIFAVLHIGVTIVSAVAGAFKAFFSGVSEGTGAAQGGILKFFSSIAKIIVGFDNWLSSGNKLKDAMATLGNTAGVFVSPLVAGIGQIIRAFSRLIHGQGIDAFIKPLEKAKNSFLDFISGILGGLATITAPFSAVSGVFKKLQGMIEGFKSTFKGVDAPMAAVSARIADMSGVVDTTTGKISSSFNKFKKSTEGVRGSVERMYSSISGATANKAKSAAGGLSDAGAKTQSIWAKIGGVFDTVGNAIKGTFQRLGDAVKWVSDQFGQLFGGMDALDWASVINAIFSGALILSLKNFADTFTKIGSGVTDTLSAMESSLKADAILAIAVAIGVLAASLVILSLIDIGGLGKALGAIGILTAILVKAMTEIEKIGKSADGKIINKFNADMLLLSASMLLLAGAMLGLALAVAIFGNMDMGTLIKGIGALAIVMGIMVNTMKSMSGLEGSFVAAGAGMILMSIAINIMAGAIALLGNMDMSTLAKGLGAMSIGLNLMVTPLILMAEMAKGVFVAAAAIGIVAGAMVVMATAVALFGNMDLKTLGIGFTAMGVALTMMTVSLALLGSMGPGILEAAGAMALMSFSLIQMAIAVGMFGNMDASTLAKGFIAVAVGLGLLITAAALAEAVAPGLITLGLVFGLLGAAMFLAGVGMLAFATGFAILTAAGVAGVAIITLAIKAFLALLPSIAVQFAAAFVVFFEVIAKAAPRLRAAFSTIFRNIIGVIVDAIPEIQKLMQTLINTGIEVIKKSVPKWVEMGFTIIDEFLKSAANHVPSIADSAGELIVNFIRKLDSKLSDIVAAGTDLIVHFLQGLGKNAAKIADAAGQMILDILNGIDAAVVKYSDQIRQAGINILGHLIDGITGGFASQLQGAVSGAFSNLHIPDIPGIPGLRSIAGRGLPGKGDNKRQASIFKIAAKAVKSALALANAHLNPDNDPLIKRAAQAARKASAGSEVSAARAQVGAKAARDADKKAREAAKRVAKKGLTDNQEAAAKKAQKAADKAASEAHKRADKLAKTAQKDQDKASRAASNLADTIAFHDADLNGKGDIRSEQAASYADRANALLAKANSEAAQAKKLQKTDKKAAAEMLKQAQKDAAEARKLAERAKGSQEEANKYYEQEINDRIKQIEDDAAAEAKAKADESAYNAADQAGKAEILKNRALADQAAADAAKANADALIEQAKSLAATDPTKAMELLDKAEEQAALAKESADKAEEERKQAAELLNQPGTDTGTNAPKPGIQPSRSVLEDAAKAVDRYTESLSQAQELATANQQVIQYNQNVYSPAALSASEVYRQSKNLLSAAEIKMGG